MRFVPFESFWCANVKNNFLKIKKHHWHAFRHEKLFEKQPLPHCQTRSESLQILYIFSFFLSLSIKTKLINSMMTRVECDFDVFFVVFQISLCCFYRGCQFHFVSFGMTETFHINSKNRTKFISFQISVRSGFFG